MTGRQPAQGYAIALLMWMIAGMALLVMAVIQFARDDIGSAEQRLSEAKSNALARGVALLALRDAALAPFLSDRSDREDGPNRQGGEGTLGNSDRDSSIFSRRYELSDHIAVATVHPASGFVSLNGASEEELQALFRGIGGASGSEAIALAGAVIDYRNQRSSRSAVLNDFAGFRSREELLTVDGMRKAVYDRVKDFVQPFEASSLDLSRAPKRLRQLFPNGAHGGQSEAGWSGNRGSGSASVAASDGLVTFESLNRQRAARISANTHRAVIVKIQLDNGQQSNYRVWVAGATQRVIHSERLSIIGKEGQLWQ